ncbi:uncharacterized protein FA14DRAFT_25467 [Meira miltonrushii]|uniref:Zn(2)-C6 fungal-type domain-containing protein n=1 Tax=Meira miltonrushii TaxID=1280837 RepID=A0A316VLG0_9BASI|nr:uncharacterized protein FA14DRAFT_25467 [Meira miltonrushii]PWN38300.1 hypothetical protein FA14DRAFT_25467 [Meira miltonrushii]
MVGRPSQSYSRDESEELDSETSSVVGNDSTNMTEAGNLSNRPPPKKRNRAALSCTLCRERKVKCDRVIPCQQCIKRGDADFCHLDPSKKGPDQKKKGGRTSKAKDEVQHDQVPMQYNPYGPSQFEQFSSTLSSMAPPQQQKANSTASPASSSASEVDAIKARLAQLEQVLAQRQSQDISPGFGSAQALSDAASIPGLSPRYPWQPSLNGSSNASGSFVTSPMNQIAAGNSPSNPINHRSNSASSPSRTGFAAVFAQQQQQQGGVPGMSNSPSSGSLQMVSPSTGSAERPSSHRSGSGKSTSKLNSKPRKTDNIPSTDSNPASGPRGEVDSDTEDAALVLEGLAMGRAGECGEKKTLKPERAALEIIEKDPVKSIQGFVEEDRAEDIMTEGKYSFEKKKTSADKDGCGISAKCDYDDKDGEAATVLREFLRKNPDAVFGPDGQRLSPAKRVCVLLSRHESLFNLVWGPETFLGWGMGWAFPAAEAAGDMMNVSEVVGCKGALQREAVLRAIIRSLPEREVAMHLVDVFDSRVKFLAGNCFHVPTFKKDMSAFYDLATVEKRARVINFVDPGWLSLMLMIFVLALHFHPCERPELVQHLFDGRTIHLWRSAAQTSLVLARYQSSSSMAVLQTIILINLLSMGQGKENFSLTHTAISNALEMGLHRLGDKDKQAKAGECPATSIRREMAKRIWHQLTFTDWCSATIHAGSYRIHPHQFNTPLPGNYNDEDLCQCPQPAPRPDTEHTDMSYSLAMLKLADISRQNVDMIHSSEGKRIACSDMAYLDTSYRGLLEQAPSFYKIGSDEGAGANIEVERWLFQQSVFHKLLRLHRPQLSSRTSARTSCVLLARSILDMQRRIRSRCSVVDRLFVNLAQSFSAAIVLCLDLLQTRPSATMRSIVRGEIFEALKALRHVGASHHTTENSIRVIEALLEEEECRWNSPQSAAAANEQGSGKRRRGENSSGRGERRKDMLNLALRVAKAAHGDGVHSGSEDVDMADGDHSSATDSHDEPTNDQAMAQRIKDQQSRQMFDQLLAGRPTFAEPSSFSSAPFQTNVFDQPRGTVAPNGLDFGFGWTPPNAENGQMFDLTKFLAEAETNSSPGNGDNANSSAASDSGHSSLHGGRANSTSSGHLSHSSSFSNGPKAFTGSATQHNGASNNTASSGGDPTHSPVDTFSFGDGVSGPVISPSAFERPSTNLDGFWNWVLAQGSSGFATTNSDNVQQAPLGGGGAVANGLQQTLQNTKQNDPVTTSAPPTSVQQAQFANALAQNINGGMGANPVSSATIDANLPAAAPQQSSNPFAAGSSVKTPSTGVNASGSELPFYSVGTPSAGMGNSWMSTPGLFDFAYEFGGEGQSSSQQNNTSAATNTFA